jgi:hypothetical protein
MLARQAIFSVSGPIQANYQYNRVKKMSHRKYKFVPLCDWILIYVAFKLEMSKTQVSSAFTPIDVKLFNQKLIFFMFVFLLSTRAIS